VTRRRAIGVRLHLAIAMTALAVVCVVLTGQRVLRVTVNRANYTSQLTASDARCPTADGRGFTVGFDITFDVHTGAIVYVKPGLDCVVC